MCGIFGVLIRGSAGAESRAVRQTVDHLFRLSETRGREAAGLAIMTSGSIFVYKVPQTASAMLRRNDYAQLFRLALGSVARNGSGLEEPIAVIGHSRLVTNGAQLQHGNNQPVVSEGVVAVHNGIVVNDADLWRQHPELERRTQVDTEIIVQLLRHFHDRTGRLDEALASTFTSIYGECTIAAFLADLNAFVLGTNTGSLYVSRLSWGSGAVFASERHILNRLRERREARAFAAGPVEHVAAGTGWIVDLEDFSHVEVSLAARASTADRVVGRPVPSTRRIQDMSPTYRPARNGDGSPTLLSRAVSSEVQQACGRNTAAIDQLRRCRRCVLPETMPFISFDRDGVCNFCRAYVPLRVLGRAALEAELHPPGSAGRECLITLSGGRDSSYGLHYVTRELGLKAIAYTYDWGMVTDLARRNQARLCGKLGVEHIWVSADINRKRRNIRSNVLAWLRRPDLGTIPLFMAGDKQFFYYANKVREQTGVDRVMLCENLLEKTDFKSGFCGVPPAHGSSSVYSLSVRNNLRMVRHYGLQFLRNPHYLNASILDTIAAYASYYVIDHSFVSLYRYIGWDENTIESTLIGEYDWETAPDTRSTWRIGDGTAPFYNYIYYNVAGFTENDTFRSNQIREGKLDRSEALRRIREDNRPRYDAIRWYCDTIGIDMERTLKRIHEIPTLYSPAV